jgi:hypothetical protein
MFGAGARHHRIAASSGRRAFAGASYLVELAIWGSKHMLGVIVVGPLEIDGALARNAVA